MSLEPAAEPDSLYLAVGEEVNKARPIFTGDIFREVELAGVGTTPAIVIAHPCSIRGRDGALQEQILVAAVSTHQPEPAAKWSNGFYDRVPLPGLPLERGFHTAPTRTEKTYDTPYPDTALATSGDGSPKTAGGG